MDGDDIAYPSRMQSQFEYLQAHTAVDLVSGSILVFRGDDAALGVRRGVATTHEEICAFPCSGFSMAHPTWMGRTEWFRHNPYNAGMVRMEDWELLFRTYQHSRFANLPQIALGYREESLSLRKILIARQNKCIMLLRSVWEGYTLWRATSGVLGQIARSLVDIAAIGFNLNYRLLKHRVPPVSSEEVVAWRDVLKKTRDTVQKHIVPREVVSA
jgi:hypothetical protein